MQKAAGISLYVVCGIFALAVAAWTYKMFIYAPSVEKVEVVYKLPKDSAGISKVLIANEKATESLVKTINKQEEQLQERYELFLKAREDDADITRMLSSLGAFLLALFAIFGIKSYAEFKDKVEKNAEELAKQKAEEIAITKAAEVASSKADEVASAKATEVATSKANEIATLKANEVASTKAEQVAQSKANEVAKEQLCSCGIVFLSE